MNALVGLSNYFYTFPAWPPLIVGACSLVLGFIILIREQASYASRAFAALCTCVAVWLLSIGMLYSALDPDLALLMARLSTVAVAFIPSTLLIFTTVIVRQFDRWKDLTRLSLVLSGAISTAVFDRNYVIVGLKTFPWGSYPQVNGAATVFLAFFLTLYIFSVFLLYRQTVGKRLLNVTEDRDRHLWIAFSVGFLACIDFLACFGIQVYPIGYLPVYASLLILAQTIWRYRFSPLTAAFTAPHIIRTMPGGLIVTDPDGQIVIANDKSAEYLGRPITELQHSTIQNILGDLFSPVELQRLIAEDGLRDYEMPIQNVSGERRVASFSGAIMNREDKGPPAGFIFIIRDVTRRHNAEAEREKAQTDLYQVNAELEDRVKQRTAALTEEIKKREVAEEALKALAVTDALTGLYNRRGFLTQAGKSLEWARREGCRFLALIADVDGLKPLNDTYGHPTGDRVLTQTADLLRATFRSTDVVARIGGDEFAIGVIEAHDFTEDIIRSRFRDALNTLNASSAVPYRLSISIGVAWTDPHHAMDLDHLMAEADASLYQQKKLKPALSLPPSAPDNKPDN